MSIHRAIYFVIHETNLGHAMLMLLIPPRKLPKKACFSDNLAVVYAIRHQYITDAPAHAVSFGHTMPWIPPRALPKKSLIFGEPGGSLRD
jgi:hypothetical protein